MPELAEHAGIPIENITYLGTHTHSAPVTTFRAKESARHNINDHMKQAMKRYEDMVHEKLFAQVDKASWEYAPRENGLWVKAKVI